MTTSAGSLQVRREPPLPPKPHGSPRLALGAAAALLVVAAGTAGFVGSLSGAGSISGAGKASRPSPAIAANGYGANGTARSASFRALGPAVHAAASSAAAGAPVAPAARKAASTLPGSKGGSGQDASQGGRIEETGTVTVVVRAAQIQPDMGRLMTLAQGLGGFVASTDTQSASSGSPAQGTVTLQVPVADFATAVSDSRALGKVAALSTQAVDVTGQYVDLQAQITAAQASRQQYLTIMAKATTVGSVLAVQEQLDNVESQLQQLQGQLKQLSTETTYSTLTVTLTQKVVPPPPVKHAGSLLKAWRAAVNGFVSGFEAVVRVAGPLAFALLLLAALYFGGRSLWRLRLRRRGAAPRSSAAE